MSVERSRNKFLSDAGLTVPDLPQQHSLRATDRFYLPGSWVKLAKSAS